MNELGRKSNLQEEEMNELRNMYDGERRKTMAVEKTISQLTNENKSLNGKVRDLEDILEDEKRNTQDIENKMTKAYSIIDALER